MSDHSWCSLTSVFSVVSWGVDQKTMHLQEELRSREPGKGCLGVSLPGSQEIGDQPEMGRKRPFLLGNGCLFLSGPLRVSLPTSFTRLHLPIQGFFLLDPRVALSV